MGLPAFQIKKKQYIYFGILMFVGIAGALTVYHVFSDDGKPRQRIEKAEETRISSVGERVSPQEVWVERLESENKLTQEKLKTLEKLLTSTLKKSEEDVVKNAETMRRIEESRQRQKETGSLVGSTLSGVLGAENLPPPPTNRMPAQAGNVPPQNTIPQGVKKVVLNLVSKKLPSQKDKEISTVENTIPAGAFAKAVLLGGVDASTSISSQSDPRPVLLRITDKGNLPRRFKSDLQACHVLASSYGDLSSERVYMRLEKLTCTERLTGEISETQVAGYVVGEDGRAGIRGVVTDRAGPLLRNSAIGGFLGGVSNFFGAQSQRSVYPVSPFGQTNQLSVQDMLSAGASTGVSGALDKYAEFYIKRAEQLQPVLQVAAGRSVDIVFTEGTVFGETSVRKTLSKIRNASRKEAVRELGSQPDKKEWLPSVGETE